MVRRERDGAVCLLTLDRPARRNALTRADLRDLRAAVEATDAPVVHLRGEGPAFCAGADLDVVADLDRESARAFAELGQDVARAIERADPVVVAGLDGPARGGGVELALACDLRVATPDATFAETGVRLGLFGAWGGTARLPRIVGEGVAADLTLSGRTVDADLAREWGLVSRIVDDPGAVARDVAEAPASTLRRLKPLVRATDRGDRDADEGGESGGGAPGAEDDERTPQERREAAAFADLVAEHGDALRERRG
jgi:enoyl-CoA hydratase